MSEKKTTVCVSGAEISDCGCYRYALWRKWSEDPAAPLATFLMLNPSTADAHVDDPTIRKCCGFARRWGCAGIWVVNLFAFRATNPRDLFFHSYETIVGPKNDEWVSAALKGSYVCAWGAAVSALATRRARDVLALASVHRVCLGVAADGSPRHPLMLSYATKPVPWKGFAL
jgi:hypothetical protein